MPDAPWFGPMLDASALDDDVALHEARQRAAALKAAAPARETPTGPQSRLGARTLGALSLAVPGCTVFSDPSLLCDLKTGNGIGGVLIAITDTPNADGEIHRAYRVWDLHTPAADSRPGVYPARWGNWRTIGEEVCGQQSVEGIKTHLVAAAARQMAAELHRRGGQTGRTLFVSRDHDLVHDLMVLDHVLLGGVRG